MVGDAVEVAYKYLRDKKFKPNESDVKLFEHLEKILWENHATAGYIARCMRQRMNGEPEGSKKFTDPEVFDYHYPP